MNTNIACKSEIRGSQLNIHRYKSAFASVCGRGGIGRRAALRSLWGKTRGSSSLLDRTRQFSTSFTASVWSVGFSKLKEARHG